MKSHLKKSLSCVALLSLFAIGCSHVSMERSPSSVSPWYANCEKVSTDENNRHFEIWVDGESYLNETYRSHEADRMLTRLGQTQTCQF